MTALAQGAGSIGRAIRRPLGTHPFVVLLLAGTLVGGGLRFIPTSAAAGSSGTGHAASTACAAT